jgi:molybdopterin-guanine dinucleotide biosynthesis protein A
MVNNRSIIQRQLLVLKQFIDDVFTVGNNTINIPNFKDKYTSIGPLAGIFTALSYARGNYVFVFSCDMPFLNKSLIQAMISTIYDLNVDVLVPLHNDKIEPLHAIYKKSIVDYVENQIKNKQCKIRLLYQWLDVVYFEVDKSYNPEISFFNINYPEDIIKAEVYAKTMEF